MLKQAPTKRFSPWLEVSYLFSKVKLVNNGILIDV